ncbi:MAG: hypothetical protein ACK4ND_18695 [Cytophagaceae bacterium]
MKVYIFYISLLLLTGILASFITKRKAKATIYITHTFSYCKGVAPTHEEMMNWKKPIAYSGKKLYLKKGEINDPDGKILNIYTTDENGLISLSLPKGLYYLVCEEKKDRSFYKRLVTNFSNKSSHRVDLECLDKWLQTPDIIVDLRKVKGVEVSHNFHEPCSWNKNPCTQYFGPLPP